MIKKIRIFKELDKIEVEAFSSSDKGLLFQEKYKQFEEEINNANGALTIYLENDFKHRSEVSDISQELKSQITSSENLVDFASINK
jgi:hypothetical protein